MSTGTHPHTNISTSTGFHRPSINMVAADRVARVVFAVVAIAVGVALLTSAATALAVILEAALIFVGLFMLAVGISGFCPSYYAIGYVPRSLRKTP